MGSQLPAVWLQCHDVSKHILQLPTFQYRLQIQDGHCGRATVGWFPCLSIVSSGQQALEPRHQGLPSAHPRLVSAEYVRNWPESYTHTDMTVHTHKLVGHKHKVYRLNILLGLARTVYTHRI
jgi:hypothetical protein